jgi:solute carrier family 25 folate transporter 32
MHPLDLLKVRFQVANRSKTVSSVGKEILAGLQSIVKRDGWTGLYRGLGVNTVGNAASWGAYFLW